MLPFEYEASAPLNLEEKAVVEDGISLITFDAPYEPEVPQSKRVRVYYYKSESPVANLVFLHGIRNGNIPYLAWLAKCFSKHGIDSYYMILPYHEKRAPDGWRGGEPFFSPSPAKCVVKFHEAVKDVRRTVDVISMRSDLPIFIMGYSFGGMIATMSLAVEKRLKGGVLSFTGGNWRWINWHSPVTDELREMYRREGNEFGCRSERDCLRFRKDPLSIVERFEKVEDIFKKSPVTCFHYDPLSFAKFVNQPVLFFKGIFDLVIPCPATEELIRVLSNKKVVSIPSGHKSSYFFRRFIARLAVKFVKKHAMEASNTQITSFS